MVHQYKMGGYNIVIDVNSGAIHVVDDMTYDMIEMYESSDKDSIFAEMAKRYPDHKDEIAEVWDEIAELIAAEELFTKDSYEPYITDFAKRAGLNNKAATDLILVQAAGLEKLLVELANQRMRKYELKAPGLTLEQMQATYDDIIKQMDHLMEAYNNG